MGRRAKYLTLAEKGEASRKHKEDYRKTERQVSTHPTFSTAPADQIHSAKTLRIESNRRAYARRQEARRLPPIVKLKVPYLPYRLRQLAASPIPTTDPRYKRAYESNCPIEEDDELAQFFHPPPYTISEDLKEAGVEKISVFIQGKQEKALKNLELERLNEQYKRQDRQTFYETVHGDIKRHLQEWYDLREVVDRARLGQFCLRPSCRCDFVPVMSMQVLRWKARLIMNAVEDLEAASCKEEDERYIRVFLDRWDRR